MAASMIDGKAAAARLRASVAAEADEFSRHHGRRPRLVVVIVGDNPASRAYVRTKTKMAAEAGLDGELVEGAQDGEGLLHVTPVECGDAGVDAGLGLHQTDLGEPGERLAHRGAAETEALGELTVLDLLTGDEFAAHDGVAQPVEDLLAEEAAGDRAVE